MIAYFSWVNGVLVLSNICRSLDIGIRHDNRVKTLWQGTQDETKVLNVTF